MEHWLDSSAYILAHRSDLSSQEQTAFDFLNSAWRSRDFSQQLADEARANINVLVSNDELHGNQLQMKTNIQRFRGVAANIYTVSEEDYLQFRTELRLRFGAGHDNSSQPQKQKPGQQPPRSDRGGSGTTPPPPPPQAGKPKLTVSNASIDIMSPRGSVLRAACTSIPEGTEILRPLVAYRTNVVGSRWKVTCRLVNDFGRELAISVNDRQVLSPEGTLELAPFSNCAAIPAGDCRLLVYVNGDLRIDTPLTVTPAAGAPQGNVSLTIKDIVSCDHEGNLTAPKILTTARFIAPVVEVSSSTPGRTMISLRVSIFSPDGALVRTDRSPVGLSFSQNVAFSGSETVTLKPFGSDSGLVFKEEGVWRIEIMLGNGQKVTRKFTVRRPEFASSPLSVGSVDFLDINTDSDNSPIDRPGDFRPAPADGDDYLAPRIGFTLNSAVDVVEVSYTLCRDVGGVMQPVRMTPPQNYPLDGSGRLLLDVMELGDMKFEPGTYGISFRINGAETAVYPFEVAEPKRESSLASALAVIVGVATVLGIMYLFTN